MHVLIVNDDGPPSQTSSPYVHSFISELQAAGIIVSVVLPHTQRSWIGKAHLVGQTVTPSYFRPGTLHTDDGTTHPRPRADGGEEWILVDGTPASCVQIGLNHYFKEKGPIDLVISGPNYGRNSTALFALSSGTVGGALEGAVCGKRSIALSYAFHNRNHDPVIIKGASQISVRLIKHLFSNWADGVDLYTVNVPLIEGINNADTKVLYTNMLQNYWSTTSSFEEVDAEDDLSPEETEAEIREHGEGLAKPQPGPYKHKKFKWAPKFTDVHKSVEESSPGNDGWAVKEGHVSVTPLKSNFMHYDGLVVGKEIKLDSAENTLAGQTSALSLNSGSTDDKIYCVVDYEDSYVQPKIIAALTKLLPSAIVIADASSPAPADAIQKHRVLHWSAYEKLDFEAVMERPDTAICCSYIIRKALIRKHHLALTVRHHTAKHAGSALAAAFPLTCDFELDYADFLDEALAEAFEVAASLVANAERAPADREWWILKPGMSDRGQGIRLFSTENELRAIFEEFEELESDSEDDGGERGEEKDGVEGESHASSATDVVTSQLRHFVAQAYVRPPALVDGRKFHLRVYVLAVAGLRVYVYRPVLALFAAHAYHPPWELDGDDGTQDLAGHLTNTCLQSGEREGSVRRFWDLADELGGGAALENVWASLCTVVAETFEAAARGQRVHFQAIPNAFEIYGVDFMLDADLHVYLLEVNAYPDFKQTGDELSELIGRLFEQIVAIAVKPFFRLGPPESGEADDLEKVLDIELGSW